ncbi:DUF1045 domain-containing protein [Ensifer soli]|uniref:DUF1045 domain-containing protein n=1 Tax=Ciceribacter sp. sgz301302 TaxID=3342379 RepID=UPI0035BAF127
MRYALYITPPQHDALTIAAARWLGRDAFLNGAVPHEDFDGFSPDEISALTAEPRRYGFHGTVKAPFELAPGRSETELLQALEEFSAEVEPFVIPALVLGEIGPFFALVPERRCEALHVFADEAVRRFEPFRAPLGEADIARRHPDRLTASQRRNLATYGYPHVLGDFRYHMTLTGPVAPERRATVRALLEDRFAAFIGAPLTVDTIGLFTEARRGAPFAVHSLPPLGTLTTPRMTAR